MSKFHRTEYFDTIDGICIKLLSIQDVLSAASLGMSIFNKDTFYPNHPDFEPGKINNTLDEIIDSFCLGHEVYGVVETPDEADVIPYQSTILGCDYLIGQEVGFMRNGELCFGKILRINLSTTTGRSLSPIIEELYMVEIPGDVIWLDGKEIVYTKDEYDDLMEEKQSKNCK